ncbi:hypothetical protein PG993_011874 [Apiospora rasikravindrae]|uniref:Uncharacterized protein n=1 Tax=Apiospora rasikravindrae TaxID=990691 RepID=A0ABR1S0Z4_9PEZI
MGQQSNNTASFSEKLEALRRWAKLKQYQIEVTYAVNAYTPLEKVFFYSLVLVLFTLSAAAMALYLLPPASALVWHAWYILSDDVPQIASHLWAADKMVLDESSGPAVSPLESPAMSI